MRFVRSNPEYTMFYVIWVHKGRETIVSKHTSEAEACAVCWPEYKKRQG